MAKISIKTWLWCFILGFCRFISGFYRFISGFDRFISGFDRSISAWQIHLRFRQIHLRFRQIHPRLRQIHPYYRSYTPWPHPGLMITAIWDARCPKSISADRRTEDIENMSEVWNHCNKISSTIHSWWSGADTRNKEPMFLTNCSPVMQNRSVS